MTAEASSPCKTVDRSGGGGAGNFYAMDCSWERVYSKQQVTLDVLPTTFGLQCDSAGKIHAGLDSVNPRNTWGYRMPWGHIECLDGTVLLDWRGHNKSETLARKRDWLTVTINKNRTIDFKISGRQVLRGKDTIPKAAFPVDLEFSAADSSGGLKSVYWNDGQAGSRCVVPKGHGPGLKIKPDENFIGLLLIPDHKGFCNQVFIQHLLGGACGKSFKLNGVMYTLNCRGENEWYVMSKLCLEPCFRDPKQACCGMPKRFSSIMPCRTMFSKTRAVLATMSLSICDSTTQHTRQHNTTYGRPCIQAQRLLCMYPGAAALTGAVRTRPDADSAACRQGYLSPSP